MRKYFFYVKISYVQIFLMCKYFLYANIFFYANISYVQIFLLRKYFFYANISYVQISLTGIFKELCSNISKILIFWLWWCVVEIIWVKGVPQKMQYFKNLSQRLILSGFCIAKQITFIIGHLFFNILMIHQYIDDCLFLASPPETYIAVAQHSALFCILLQCCMSQRKR